MAIEIKLYKNMKAEDLTKDFITDGSKLEVGSFAALAAAAACSLLERAVFTMSDGERKEWLLRNIDKQREYMINLIDEDVKCRGPLRKALSEGDETRAMYCRESASAIASEIVNMQSQILELGVEIINGSAEESKNYVKEGAELAMGAIRSCIIYINDMIEQGGDDTNIYVTRREFEMIQEQCETSWKKILES